MADIAGSYKHFKGRYYTVFCEAYDTNKKKYVLYRQNYGDKSFWLRPYDMFFQEVALEDGSLVQRFKPTNTKKLSVEKQIKALVQLINEQKLFIRDSEMEIPFAITEIDESCDYVMVHPIDAKYASGYLTEYELVQRMNYDLCLINKKSVFLKKKNEIDEDKVLRIGDKSIEALERFLNPCSIDLQIADSGYLTTKHKSVDPQSIEYVSSAIDLWKPVKVYSSKSKPSRYIRLRPGMIILTHTKERIRIPLDCAGKIEIKSTFARLSLSITEGDFCNPGYDGYFPLEIKNGGKHTVIIHESETMAQLMLVPLQGPILNKYANRATFKNQKGYDEGTPYSFWNERSIKALRNKEGTQQIIDLSNSVLDNVTYDNTEDVNAFKTRFSNTFLPYCQKHINKAKYKSRETGLPDTRSLLLGYINAEKRLKLFFGLKWGALFMAVATFIWSIIKQILKTKAQTLGLKELILGMLPLSIAFILFLLLSAGLFFFTPKVFCTFEKLDIDDLINDSK